MREYEVGEIPPEELEKQKKRPYFNEDEEGGMVIFNPDDGVSKAFAEAYYDGSQELRFLGKKVKAEEKLNEEDKAIDLAIKTAELMKKSGFDKTLKELEEDD